MRAARNRVERFSDGSAFEALSAISSRFSAGSATFSTGTKCPLLPFPNLTWIRFLAPWAAARGRTLTVNEICQSLSAWI